MKQKRPYKKRKTDEISGPAVGESKSFTKKREYYLSRSKELRPDQPSTLYGQPIDGQWVHTAAGWARRGHSQVEKLPQHQISRYFKITKILEEVDEDDILKEALAKERSELPVPELERSVNM